ncbi:AAA family ATPase [Paenibacillus sp. NPDC057934]|uniref:AAA family ATPase n=1 Tax=Paenibacillus sp. NPDC057934 TaxID=3346282 RepID=UPI0036DC37B8
MSTIHMLTGIPGSGKTTYAKQLCRSERAVLVATDDIRERLFGSESKQKNNYLVFDTAFAEIEQVLADGRNVVFDATNIDRGRRLKFLKRFSEIPIECHVCDAPYELALTRNKLRKRRLDEVILLKYAKNFAFPVPGEGFSALHIVHAEADPGIVREELEQLLAAEAGHDELFRYLSTSPYFAIMLGFDQGNPYHSKTLSEHTYSVLEYINQCYEGEHLLAMQLAALLHDTGKPLCKVWKQTREYYSYFGHEHVSAIIACNLLKALGYDDDFVLHVVYLVSFHMEILHGGDAGASNIYHLLGGELLAELYFFAEADSFGK